MTIGAGAKFYVHRTRGHFTYRLADEMNRYPLDSDFRPLVVIDPEDREQVERLLRLFWDRDTDSPLGDDLQAALRDFANPTPAKPAEPQGLGAVVRDASGRVLVRTSQDRKRPWCVAGTNNHVGWVEMDDEPLEVVSGGTP